jgi:hypothetical protein
MPEEVYRVLLYTAGCIDIRGPTIILQSDVGRCPLGRIAVDFNFHPILVVDHWYGCFHPAARSLGAVTENSVNLGVASTDININ